MEPQASGDTKTSVVVPASTLPSFDCPESMDMPSTIPGIVPGSTLLSFAPGVSMDMPSTVPGVLSFAPGADGVDAHPAVTVAETSDLEKVSLQVARAVTSDDLKGRAWKGQLVAMAVLMSYFPVCFAFFWIFVATAIVLVRRYGKNAVWEDAVIFASLLPLGTVTLVGGIMCVIGSIWICVFCCRNPYCRTDIMSFKKGCCCVIGIVFVAWVSGIVIFGAVLISAAWLADSFASASV